MVFADPFPALAYQEALQLLRAQFGEQIGTVGTIIKLDSVFLGSDRLGLK
jgi:hypothetical protein